MVSLMLNIRALHVSWGKMQGVFLHRRVFTQMKKETVTTNQITEGVIWKQLLLFFFPIVLGTFFQQLYNTADTIVVGVCQQRSSCRRRWFRRTDCRSDRGILRRTGFRCFGYHFPVLRCQRQSTAEPCPAYCLCILYHWKYFHHRSGNSDCSLDA